MAWTRPSRGASPHLRKKILERDNYACQHCGNQAHEVDAILNDKRGGSHKDPDNLQSLCRDCHAAKTHEERVWAQRQSLKRRAARKRLPVKPHPGLIA